MKAQHATVLLADDDPNDIFLMRRAFKRSGSPHLLQVVPNGDEVINYLSGSGRYLDRSLYPFPSLVLLDVKMPRKNGLEVLEWMRSQPYIRRVPVVVLTSSRQPVDVNRAYELGANSYMVKPVTFDRLLEMVCTLNHYWLSLVQSPLNLDTDDGVIV